MTDYGNTSGPYLGMLAFGGLAFVFALKSRNNEQTASGPITNVLSLTAKWIGIVVFVIALIAFGFLLTHI